MPEAAHAGVGAPTVIIVSSSDVVSAIGRAGLIERRLVAAGRSQQPIEVVREPGRRTDVLVQQLTHEPVPAPTAPPGLGAWLADTRTTRIGPGPAVVVMSLLDEMTAEVFRHRSDGYLVQPPEDHRAVWSQQQLAWLDSEFALEPAIDPSRTADNLRIISEAAGPGSVVVVFNVSTYTPGEKISVLPPDGPEPLAVTANRFDLMLDQSASHMDIAVVDVDRVVAELGAGDHVPEFGRFSEAAASAVAEEALRVLTGLEIVSSSLGSDAMRLAVPRYDRRTERGTITAWHCAPGSVVAEGDALFDVSFHHLHHRLGHGQVAKKGRAAGAKRRVLSCSVVALRDGVIAATLGAVGEEFAVGDTVGVVALAPDAVADAVDDLMSFPVGVRVHGR